MSDHQPNQIAVMAKGLKATAANIIILALSVPVDSVTGYFDFFV
jgi:hypothetical protein